VHVDCPPTPGLSDAPSLQSLAYLLLTYALLGIIVFRKETCISHGTRFFCIISCESSSFLQSMSSLFE